MPLEISGPGWWSSPPIPRAGHDDSINTGFFFFFLQKTVDSKMNLIMSLMREVEWREKAAKKAKQEVDNCTLDINLEMDELIMAQQQVKESNDKVIS